MRIKKQRKDTISGFTLVELLVAMFLGILLTAGISNIYLESKRNFVQDEELSRMQENARFALNLLRRELTMAGFYGGMVDYSDATAVAVNSDCAAGNWALDVSTPLDVVRNVDNAGSSLVSEAATTITCIDNDDVEDGTDMISVKRTAGDYTLKNGDLNTTDADANQWYLRVFDGTDFNFTYVASDIASADATAGSKYDYWEYYAKIFYIQDYSMADTDGIPTLCARELVEDDMVANCYVEGVEDMQIELGIDTDADGVPNQYKEDPTAAELSSAVTARVYLLVRSVNPVVGYTNSKAYNLGQKAVAAKDDAFMRRVYSTTIKLRNPELS